MNGIQEVEGSTPFGSTPAQAENYENEATIWTQLERNFEPREDALRPGLESCGLAADDTATILSGIATGQRLEELARQISAGQILTKRTAHGRRHFLQAIKRRYLNAPSPLPGIEEVAAVLPALTSRTAKNQVLLPYLLLSDRTAFEIVRSTILPCRQHGETRLLKDHILAALYTVFRRHGRKPWGNSLCIRWVEGLLSVLRDIGALGRSAERERLLPYAVRPEVFSFHLWGLYGSSLVAVRCTSRPSGVCSCLTSGKQVSAVAKVILLLQHLNPPGHRRVKVDAENIAALLYPKLGTSWDPHLKDVREACAKLLNEHFIGEEPESG